MELDELGFVHLLAVDPGSVVAVSHPDHLGAPPVLRHGRGSTPAAALAGMGRGNERILFMGGASYLLIGEEQAGENLTSALNLIFADYSARMDVYVYIVRDGTASEWTQAMAESPQPVLEWMHNTGQRTRIGSPALRVKVCQVVSGLAEGEAVLIPGVSMPCEEDQAAIAQDDDEDDPQEAHGQVAEPVVSQPAGYAVARDGRVVGWIEAEDSPIADAMLLKKKRIAHVTLPEEYGGCAIEAEFFRKNPATLYVRIVSADGMEGEAAAALEQTLRGGVQRIGALIHGFDKTRVVVIPS
jgi:hypothetical protein